ncbi:uncharacterized protein AKAW2_60948S [Aspergillus luchuensis]|uniref:Uncharacterized protein n=1 Tax=Aspergillus kawachii TaxID=1069201 RepID=A0A7R7WHM6_ASPKA|nr:uncharacterized protein AKAW2_60948S [Aspergillus luchuensis]BCS02684.1 hypothetical protein AKAW2_60948S [Aspergillus luchuensis]BCS14343.1 hypothetical protein ALUC_60899S [Aspergillus luchuensis]
MATSDRAVLGRPHYTPVNIQAHEVSVQAESPILQRITQSLHHLRGKNISSNNTHTVLHSVTAHIPGGKLTAILGGSGSGKTTLLNALSGRFQNQNQTVSGEITYNGYNDLSRFRTAYVIQEDVLPATLTVRETLQYAADLRSNWKSGRQRDQAVDELVRRLGLETCTDTRIGHGSGHGCSGGERRRVSIAIQLLIGASVLFCDEPTTGLDATTAWQVIQTLKNLAASGMTVIISIHAPTSSVWDMFDHIILLVSGHVLYDGPKEAVPDYLDRSGFRLPAFVNPAEFIIDKITINTWIQNTPELPFHRLVPFQGSSANALDTVALPAQLPESPTPSSTKPGFWTKWKVMTKRTMVVCIRDISPLIGIACTIAGLAAVLGWIFWHLDGSLAGIRSRQGSLWDATGLYGYLMLISEICRLLEDVKAFDHERSEKLVGPALFTFSRRAVKLILEDLSLPTLFTAIYYPMLGYRDSTSQVLLFWLIMFLTHITAVGFASVSVATTRNFYGAIFIGNMYFTLQTAASGYFLQENQMPVYVQWLKWLTTTFYTFSALCTLEFVGYNGSSPGYLYDCPSHDAHDPQCKEYMGAFVMDSLGLPIGGIWKQILILCVFAVVYQASAILLFNLKSARRPWYVAVAENGESEACLYEKTPARYPTQLWDSHIQLNNLELYRTSSSSWVRPGLK